MKVLAEAEKTKVLKKYGVTEDQLPKIFSTDPAAIALKATVGNVIKIERNDGTGKYPGYRVVVEK
jgi:DNA-directed RNA polymerase subunit H